MYHYTVTLMSRTADFDVMFEKIPANSADEAKAFALKMLAAPDAWLAVGAHTHDPK